MNILAEIILPVFGLVLFGYAAGKLGWIKNEAIEGLSAFVFSFAIPVMLFRSIANADLPDRVPWDFMAGYYGSTLGLFALTILAGRMLSIGPPGNAIFAMSTSYSNVVLLGIPLVVTSLGEDAHVPLFLIVSTHAAIMFMVTTFAAELGRGDMTSLGSLPWQTLRVLIRNPIVMGLAAGLAVNLLPLSLPAMIDNTAHYLGNAALPCAVFSMGASISRYKISGDVARIASALLVKNMIHPALVWFACTMVFDISSLWTAVAVMLAGSPSGINTYLFAQRYEAIVPTAATIIVLSTLLSIPVLSLILMFLAGEPLPAVALIAQSP